MSALTDRTGARATVLAVAGLMLALFLVALDQTIVGTALPKIIAELNGFEKYAWVTTAYLLASTSMIPVIGKLGDIYGRKWFIVAGIFVFLVGSALCGAAWGMTELILFRGVQGLGAGMIFANIFTSVADIFPDPARRAKFQGIFFGVFALSSVVGPTLGGWITDNLDWRWVFYVNLPLGILSLFVLPAVLHQSARRLDAKIDYLGAATITVSVVSLLLSLSWVGEGYAWDAERVVAGFIVSAVILVAFIFIELRAPEPIIPLWLFKSRVFSSAALLMFLVGIGMFGIILYTPLFVQGVLGKTATGSGTVLDAACFLHDGCGDYRRPDHLPGKAYQTVYPLRNRDDVLRRLPLDYPGHGFYDGHRGTVPYRYRARARAHNADRHTRGPEHGGEAHARGGDFGDAVHPFARLDGRDGGRWFAGDKHLRRQTNGQCAGPGSGTTRLGLERSKRACKRPGSSGADPGRLSLSGR